jgi:hypothetical protein
VRVAPLDTLGLEFAPPVLLKLDVQGYEDHVLSGARDLLAEAALLECELSLAHLYDDQATFAAMVARMDGLGFALVDVDPFFCDLDDGRVLALDGLFRREHGTPEDEQG